MIEWRNSRWNWVLIPVVLLAAALIVAILAPAGYNDTRISRVSFTGNAAVGQEDFRPLECVELSDWGTGSITLRGHLSRAIPEGASVFFRTSHLALRMKINGTQVYENTQTNAKLMQAPGDQWSGFISCGILPEDTVEITVSTVYDFTAARDAGVFLRSLCFGTEEQLYVDQLRRAAPSLVISLVLLTMGMLLVPSGVLLWRSGRRISLRILLLSGCAVCSGVWFLVNSSGISLFLTRSAVVSLMDQASQLLLAAFTAGYLATLLPEGSRCKARWAGAGLLGVLSLELLSQLLGGPDVLELQPAQLLCIFGALVWSLVGLLAEYRNKSVSAVLWTLSQLLPAMVGGTIAAGCYVLGLPGWELAMQIGFLATALALLYDQVRTVFRFARQDLAQQQEKNDLTQRQMQMALNHLQPHFLYNALNAIQFLCQEDPGEAAEAVGNFASFLRGNMDSLVTSHPISFQRELQHLKSYLSLESLRFGDRVQVRYEIQCGDFLLPALTLQPMAENSIRFGITKKPQGGTITVSAWETSQTFCVCVADNGTGFDPRMKLEEGQRSHLDVGDVEHRLAVQCGGELHIDCVPDEGTRVTILIPKQEEIP